MDSCDPALVLCFDPRDPLQSVDDRLTWRPTGNAILITATMLLAEHESSHAICWDKVAALADVCDAPDEIEDDRRVSIRLEDTNAMLEALLARRAYREPTGFQADDFGTST